MNGSTARWVALVVAAVGFFNVLLALFCLPWSPGLDEPLLYSAVYARQHFGRLFYPYYDQPLMYIHPPAKYWLVSTLVSWGLSLRCATAALFVASYLLATGAVFACRLTLSQRVATLAAMSAATTVHPFVSYGPENVTYAEIVGRLRPDDLVLGFWLGGLLWLEASRRSAWRASYSFVGSMSLGLAAAMHWFGLAALGALGVYWAAALLGPGHRALRLAPLLLGAALPIVPSLAALWPHLHEVSRLLFSQANDPSPQGIVDTWRRHAADFWYLLQWMKRHAGNVWPAAGLLAAPAWTGIPPLVFAGALLLLDRSSRVFGVAALVLPIAVWRAWHKSPGYELPEIALFLLACGWALAALVERAGDRWRLAAALGLFLVPLVTASPLMWDASRLRWLDDRHSPELLRAMGRAVIGPGASLTGWFFTTGEDAYVLNADPLDARIDFIAEREFHLASATIHGHYQSGSLRLAGFVLTPEAPSASTVYFTARKSPAPLAGFLARDGRVRRFSSPGNGWQMRVLRCRASLDELAWLSPRPAVTIAGYVPRTDHCVNRTLEAAGLEDRFASVFLRRTESFSAMAGRVLVPLLLDDAAASATAAELERRCACETLETVRGALADVPAHWLLAGLEQTDALIRFYASASDLAAGQSMDRRFAGSSAR